MKVKDEDLKRELEIAISGKDSQKACAMRLGIGIRSFKRLITRARVHGVEAVLHSNRPGSYADSFKLEVVNSVISVSLTLGIAESKYNLNKATVKAWVRKYQEGGEGNTYFRSCMHSSFLSENGIWKTSDKPFIGKSFLPWV